MSMVYGIHNKEWSGSLKGRHGALNSDILTVLNNAGGGQETKNILIEVTCLTLVLCSTRVNFQLFIFVFCNMYTLAIPLRKLTKTQLTRSI